MSIYAEVNCVFETYLARSDVRQVETLSAYCKTSWRFGATDLPARTHQASRKSCSQLSMVSNAFHALRQAFDHCSRGCYQTPFWLGSLHTEVQDCGPAGALCSPSFAYSSTMNVHADSILQVQFQLNPYATACICFRRHFLGAYQWYWDAKAASPVLHSSILFPRPQSKTSLQPGSQGTSVMGTSAIASRPIL